MSRTKLLLPLLACFVIAACAPKSRMGMVVDPETGLQFGSVISRSFVTDPSQFRDPRLKLRIRNTSGDPVYSLKSFRTQLENAYIETGYERASGDNFGLLLDVNVRYSGQMTQDLSSEFGFLGATAGTLGSYAASRGGGIETATGLVAGATLGYVLGTYQREETYIVVAEVTVGVIDKNRGRKDNTITFGKSGDKKSRRVREFRNFRGKSSTQIAVFAGGRNITQADIARQVSQRFVRILEDVI